MSIRQTDADFLLSQLSSIPTEKKRGRLKIYFGYAAGVGKTCAMLRDAQEAKKDGIDIVAGYVEPHERPETMALIKGIEMLPFLEVSYKGVTLKEFDLDGAIHRKPAVILVDELAHTNAEGCRHAKRYQDVEELLQAGIDVYSTINVQHLESLNDIVASITGIIVRERIPDSVFDTADQVELVDIEPEELIDRLHKGKIYREKQARQALNHFFTKEKLISLRQIALRRTADHVNRMAVKTKGPSKGPNEAYINEQILVCLSPDSCNAKVIRTAARMADAFHGSLTALYVETSDILESDSKHKAQIAENIRLAEQLGAQVATVYGDDIPRQIAEYARVSRISKIVMGRSSHLKKWFAKFNLVDKLIELSPNIDVYIIPDKQPSSSWKKLRFLEPEKLSLIDSLKTVGILTACTAIGFWFSFLHYSEANIIMVYIIGVLLNSITTEGRLYSVASSILSVLVFNFFFTEPFFSLQAYDPGYAVTFLVMLIAALITTTLTKRVKQQARQSSQKAYRTEVLLETSQKLQQANNQTEILSETANQMIKLLDRTVIFYPVQDNRLHDPLVFSIQDQNQTVMPEDAQSYLSVNERAVAEWVYKNNKRAGATTNTLSHAKCLYLAVRGKDTVLAVAAITMDQRPLLEIFEKSIVIAMLSECGLALEKELLDEVQKQTAIQMQQEQLRANLLRAISHDLRTPLTSISGNAGILMSNSGVLSENQKQGLYTDIYDDSMWLINLVENLLSITRLDNGALNLNMQPELLEEVIAEALFHINRNRLEHHIDTFLSDEMLMAKMDSRLIVQVIINIVDNAIKYTHKGSHISLSVKKEGSFIVVEIADDGDGISDIGKEKLFDMFYTADNISADGRRGLGLGLTLCKSIVAAHGGSIYVRDNIPQGTVFGFTLEQAEVDIYE